jgi:hypothetical protein
VTQSGPRRLWDEIEDLFGMWCELARRPEPRLWVDKPDSGPAWELEGWAPPGAHPIT